MYLSRLLLNTRNRDARRDLASPYELHRTLARVFPSPRPDADGPDAQRSLGHRLLFRAEPDAPGGPAVLVQTLAAPDWSRLPDGYARVDGPKPFEPRLSEGQRLRFRLAANPTVKKQRDGRKHGTRVPLVHPRAPEGHPEASAGYLDWLERKAEAAGLALEPDCLVDAPFEIRTRKQARSGDHRVTLFGVRFDGVATVVDPVSLLDALRSGLGPAKGFGFGLLSIAPA
jgi:CRISPR system Cascade subunit CasE